MKLEKLAQQFASQQEIYLSKYQDGVMGYHHPLLVGYSRNGKKERLFVRKKFPPFSDIVESRISVLSTPSSDEGIITVNVINGCLRDYLTLLQGSQDGLGKALYNHLSACLDQKNDPLEVIRNQYLGVTSVHVADLLLRFYPAAKEGVII